ncbi:DinB family protein [Terrimonas alba]|uniref:DinB family protein n=1 Tax=Terrimonas alba TaxID=3349636 RepID=UPI0035F4A589
MKRRIKTGSCLLAFAFVVISNCQAQLLTDIKTQLIKDWERAKTYTNEYLDVMPADKYSLKAHDSTRSFAQQMLHIAQANVFLMSNATDQQPPVWLMSNPEKSSSAQQRDSVKYYVQNSYDFCINAIKNLDVSKWTEKKRSSFLKKPGSH